MNLHSELTAWFNALPCDGIGSEHFAALKQIVLREREACAKSCDDFARIEYRLWAENRDGRAEFHLAQAFAARSCAVATRNRKDET